jgi:DNA-binding transcriptional LysR family regulator
MRVLRTRFQPDGVDICQPDCLKFGRGNRASVIAVPSRLCVSTSEAAILAAVVGAGLTRVMSHRMQTAQRQGSLVIVPEEFEQEPLPVHIVYARRKFVPLKLRAFLNWMTRRLKARFVG